jgi:hypothetical protein
VNVTAIHHSGIQSMKFRRRDGQQEGRVAVEEWSAAYAPLDPPVTRPFSNQPMPMSVWPFLFTTTIIHGHLPTH